MTSSSRPGWAPYFVNLARAVATRADCRRAQHGAVVVDQHNRVVSTGYNGHAPGGPSCLNGECPRGLLSQEECPSLSSYDTGALEHRCDSMHAESNALAFARTDTTGMTLYVTGQPCAGCIRTASAHRIAYIIWPADFGLGYLELPL